MPWMIISVTLPRPRAIVCQPWTTAVERQRFHPPGMLGGEPEAGGCAERQTSDMDTVQPDGGEEGRNVIGKQLGRPDPGRLVAVAGPARVDRDAGELLGVVGDLKGIAGIVGGKVGDQQE